ncbi:hypothetical protein EV182_007592 [Spiromyces aspiralis]|uniref:Uncharacterized protein n=1 Tax=Spiromyces aspiralis TaxID=68401 RepID=A0ACC1H7F3_9FUNG|nr:hypothetical protein EV182_007592 [Spiromyces aspiralis]
MSSTLPPKPLTDGENIAKYKAAAQVANESLAKVFAAVSPGVTVLELCQIGDKAIEEGLITQYRKAKLPRGVAFPTTVSINNVVCHVSPLPSDPEAERKIANGDVVKV